MNNLIKNDPNKDIGSAAFQIGREVDLSGIGLTPRTLKQMYIDFSGIEEAQPPAATKIDIMHKGKSVTSFNLPVRMQPHHVNQELKKVLAKVDISEPERLALARDLAQGKTGSWRDFEFIPQVKRLQVMR